MQIYLPIAELSVNIFLLLGLGGAIGMLSGMFGVGGGFLMTPLLIFSGIPPTVAVASEANQIVAASVSGVLAHWRRGSVDVKMGLVLVVGGMFGAGVGVSLFRYLRELGHVDLLISGSYVLFLGTIGSLMLFESLKAVIRRRTGAVRRRKLHQHMWVHGLPFKMRFRKSKLYISALLPMGIGFLVGVLAAIMGVGGGFIMVPAMIYLVGMPTGVVVGTSLFQIIFVTGVVTLLHAVNTQAVDVMLALILLTGSVIGAQIGAKIGGKIRGEELRTLLAIMVIGVCARMAYGLIAEPADPFSVALALG
jgi:hypothetical protein